jgi:hypothetical protein
MSLAPTWVAMKAGNANYLIMPLAAFLFLASFPAQASAQVKPTFLYSLANFYGKIPYNDARVRVDKVRDEAYVVERGIVRVFNEYGMEFFWFGDNPELESIYDLAVDETGDIFLLSFAPSNPETPVYFLIRCNYRGDVKEKMTVTGLPAGYSGFFPTYMFYQDGHFFFLNSGRMQVVVTDRKGVYQKVYDLADIIEIPEKDRPNTEIFGFNLDSEGNMLFTVAVLYKAFVVSQDGKVTASFGKAGSAPGLFGIVGGIAKDDRGNYLVVERLRSVVMVFDKEFQFLEEFGYRGDKPGNLIRPNEVAVGKAGKIFVSQLRNRGVSVFSVTNN